MGTQLEPAKTYLRVTDRLPYDVLFVAAPQFQEFNFGKIGFKICFLSSPSGSRCVRLSASENTAIWDGPIKC